MHGFKSNKMFILDLKARKWEMKTYTNGPEERSSHSVAVKDGKMYIFGGKNIDNNKLGDFWVYEFDKDSWTQIDVPEGEGPISRSGHSSGVFKNFILIYGGIHELTQELNDMYLYDTKSGSWILLMEECYSPLHNRSVHSSFSLSGKLKFYTL